MDEYESTEESEAPEGPEPSKPWLTKINEAEKAFEVYNAKCDNIDKKYANLKALAEATGDREFQIFWANMEVLRPTIYQRAPRPVVMPRYRDGGEVERKAAELLERVLETDVEMDDLHETLLLVRDDLALNGRGVPWVLDDGSCVHVDRQDFLHEPARKWQEVSWVARAAYLTKEEGVERFGDVFKQAECKEQSFGDETNDYQTREKKARVWEIWDKTEGEVYWVTEGVEVILDESEPMVNVKGFFPCPRPAYATLERRTLLPVPDFVYYRDQVDEINELTARISSLADSLRMKGFYASGSSEIGEAIETALKTTNNKAILVPVSNLAALGGNAKDAIIWMPVREVAEVITGLVALRKQIIEDVYEITGLSDIMRGNTDANETARAQTLKAQYGSVRVKERQNEMIRIARDVLRIKAEIFSENYPAQQLAQVAAMRLPTQMDMQQKLIEYRRIATLAQQQGQQPPEQPDFSKIATIEQVDSLLKAESVRPFLLEVESDSTIAPDEEAEKKSRIEFITAVGGFIQQAGQMVVAQPETAPFAAEMLKFTAGGFRAGRELGGVIDDFAEDIKKKAKEAGQQPSPEQMKAQAESQKMKAEMQLKADEAKRAWAKIKLDQERLRLDQAKAQAEHGIKTDALKLDESKAEVDALMRMREAEMEDEQDRAVKFGE